MSLKVGDKVRIKNNIVECTFGYNISMKKYVGKTATITDIYGGDNIKLDIDGQTWTWSVDVLELIENKEEIVNNFMEEYKKIVTETMELCIKKNKDYGNATDESFKQFGDVSYQVRCFDKWSRINTLLKNGKAEVSESLEDSLLDLANYLFLWVTSRRLNEK